MLAWPYGYPSVMSSFGFDRGTDAGRALGPPSTQPGLTDPLYAAGSDVPSCAAGSFDAATRGFVCEHRQRYVTAMVAFRKHTAGAVVTNIWHNDANQLAFARDARGFVAINHESNSLEQSFSTTLPGGQYCEVLSGDYEAAREGEPAGCGGTVVTVADDGSAALVVPPESAFAIHVGARL